MFDTIFPKNLADWIRHNAQDDRTLTLNIMSIMHNYNSLCPMLDNLDAALVIRLENKEPSAFIVAKSDLILISLLLERVDFEKNNLLLAAAKGLKTQPQNLTLVTLINARASIYAGNSLMCFASENKLFSIKGCWKENLATALAMRNIPAATFFLSQNPKCGITLDDLTIYQKILEHIDWSDSDNVSDLVAVATKTDGSKILKHLIEKYPIETDLSINPSNAEAVPLIWMALKCRVKVFTLILEYTTKSSMLRKNDKDLDLIDMIMKSERDELLEVLALNPFFVDILGSKNVEDLDYLYSVVGFCTYSSFKKLYDIYVEREIPILPCVDGDTIFHCLIENAMYGDEGFNYYAKKFIDDFGLDNTWLTSVNKNKQTPLHKLAEPGATIDQEIINLLYDAHIKQNVPFEGDGTGCTFFSLLLESTPTNIKNRTNIVRQLLKRPDFDPSLVFQPDNHGTTPMIKAVALRSQKICRMLYRFGTTTSNLVKIFNPDEIASMCKITGYMSIDKLLSKNIIPCNLAVASDNNGYTPLHYAVLSRSHTIAAWLYSKTPVDMIVPCLQYRGRTVLHHAVFLQDLDMVKILLKNPVKNRALIWALDTDGKTALDHALAHPHEESVKIANVIIKAGTRIHNQLISPFIYEHSLAILFFPEAPRSELLRYKHSHDSKLSPDLLSERTKLICDINSESIQSRIDDLDRM